MAAWQRYNLRKTPITPRAPDEKGSSSWIQREMPTWLVRANKVINWLCDYIGYVAVDSTDEPGPLEDKLTVNTDHLSATVTGSEGARALYLDTVNGEPQNRYDWCPFYSGLLPSNKVLFHLPVQRTVTYATSGFVGYAAVAALANSTITVTKNIGQVSEAVLGTITIAAGTTTVVLNVATDVSVVDGDSLTCSNQAIADAQLEGFGFLWKGAVS